MREWLIALVMLCWTSALPAADIQVAVASNFAETARQLAAGFEEDSGHRVSLSFGSTGKQYAQIHHGAPFHAWFSADARRPVLLEQEGRSIPGSRFTYALGRLVLWSPRADLVDDQGKVLHRDDFRYLAVANPRLAPYGLAAKQVLEKLGSWQKLQGRMVRGENIGQTFQFVKSGNAELGFVAASQVLRRNQPARGSFWLPPVELHAPIEQQALLLIDDPVARAFLEFVRSEEGRSIILANGYEVP